MQSVGFRKFALLGAAIFLYTLVVSALIQLVLLPRVFPAWHAGNGLLAGTDMPFYHQLAIDLAQDIKHQGWSVWTLRPAGQAPAGIAGALYALVAPKPWTMIPLYALLHALAGVLMARILLFIDPRWTVAVIGALPLVLFPSAATWYSQLGKDGFSIAGYLALVLGWLMLSRAHLKPRLSHIASGFLLILGGAGLIWIVRPYAVEILIPLSGAAALMLAILLIPNAAIGRLQWRWAAAALAVSWVAVATLVPLATGGFQSEISSVTPVTPDAAEGQSRPDELAWLNSGWLPPALDDRSRLLAEARFGFTTSNPEAGSNVDIETNFHQVSDVVAYVPRAAAIAFLYPVPIQWFQEGTLPQNTLMRRVAGLEMTAVYLALIMLPYAVWRWRGQLDTWLLLLFSTGMILVHALVFANLGTLYRLRYPYLMSLVGLSVAAVTAALLDRRARVPNAEVEATQR